ncbi:Prolow-density lipoprotein receptor-related protein [Dirofilaria immitis]
MSSEITSWPTWKADCIHLVVTFAGIVDETITSLAIDWITGKLNHAEYFSLNSHFLFHFKHSAVWIKYVGVETAGIHNAGRIVCPLNGQTDCAIALHSDFENQNSHVDSLHSVVLDPIDGYIYWLNRARKHIERAWMDGRHHDPHSFKDGIIDVVSTSALTLEQESAFYWVATNGTWCYKQ